MRVLVTGGAGFIGGHLVDALLARGHEVMIFDNLRIGNRAHLPKGAQFVQGSVRDQQTVLSVFGSFRPEVVAHLAAQVSVAASVRDPRYDLEVNALGTLNVLQASVDCGVRRLVFSSTGGAIYGEVVQGAAHESGSLCPVSPYAFSKLAAENYIRHYESFSGMPCMILRYANVYGPRQDPHGEAGVVAIFAKKLLAREPMVINAREKKGDHGCVRDYVYVGDVVLATLAAVEGNIVGSVINVCTGQGTSTYRIAELLSESLGIPKLVEFSDHRFGDTQRSVLDATQCAALLGRVTPLEEGICETARWFAGSLT